MQIIRVKDAQEGAKKSFEIVKKALEKGAKTFGLATGGTPEGVYALLRESDLDFSQVTSVNLDEYIGLKPDNKKSYHYYMNEQLFSVKPFKNSYLPNGVAENEQEEVERYEQILKKILLIFNC